MDQRPPALISRDLHTHNCSPSSALLTPDIINGCLSDGFENNDEFSFVRNDPQEGPPLAALPSPRMIWEPNSSSMPSSTSSIFIPNENPTFSPALLNAHAISNNERRPLLRNQGLADKCRSPHNLYKLPQEWRMALRSTAEGGSQLGLRVSSDCCNPLPSRHRRLAPVIEHEGCVLRKMAFLRRSFSFNASRALSAKSAGSDRSQGTALTAAPTGRCERPPKAAGLGKSASVNTTTSSSECNHDSEVIAQYGAPYACTACNLPRRRPRTIEGRSSSKRMSVSSRLHSDKHCYCRNGVPTGRNMCSRAVQRRARLHPIDCQLPLSSTCACSSSDHYDSCRNDNGYCSATAYPLKRPPFESINHDFITSGPAVSVLAYHYGRHQQRIDSGELARKTFLPYRTNLLGC